MNRNERGSFRSGFSIVLICTLLKNDRIWNVGFYRRDDFFK